MQKRNKIKQAKKKRILRNAGAAVLAVMLAVALVVGLVPNNALAATADQDTSTKYTESLGDNASTEYAGRIWTDKSVYDGDATFEMFGGNTTTIKLGGENAEDEDFLVAYSALATSESIEGQTQAPVDVVLILDISGSMSNEDSNMDNKKSRIYNTVQAANNAIAELMALNPYTRVAVVAFSNNAQVLLPLDRYTQSTTIEREWVSTGWFGSGYWEDVEVVLPYFSVTPETADEDYSTLYVDAVNSNNEKIDTSVSVQGGTNIQMGLYEGMQVLAEEDSTTVTIDGATVQRIPSVILLSDGSPTYSSDSRSWWAPADNKNNGPGSAPYAGNGMKAILVGSYMKDAIDRNYGVEGTAFATTVYTVGMGITGLDNDEKNLAYMTLDPGTYWNDTSVTNSMKTTIKDYWSKYTAYNNTGTLEINVGQQVQQGRDWVYRDDFYELTHPTTGYDVDPTTGYDYVDNYYDADNAAAVTDVFEQIVSNISIAAPQVPTELKGTDPITDGYITYTDPIGKYMEVKDVKSILYAGEEFKDKTEVTTGNKTTYTFAGEVDSAVYGEQEIKNIVIEVTKDTDGNETLVVKIPASVIPIRVNEVNLNADGTVKTHTNNGAYPARVIYSVGLQDGIKVADADSGEEYIDTTKLSAEYIAANIDEDGNINFYSNLFTDSKKEHGHSVGDTTVEFEPAHNNPFYYVVEDMLIYKDEACTTPVTEAEGIDDETTYYYVEEYYHGNSVEKKVIARTGEQLKESGIGTGEDGNLYRKAGSPRIHRMLEFSGHKVNNLTNTAEDFYVPTFQVEEGGTAYDGKFKVYLGNNGLLSLPAGGNLEITKNVNAAPGLTAPDKEFVFELNVDGNEVSEDTYKYVIVKQNGEKTEGTVSKNNPTITLKDGWTATVYNLSPNTEYTVTEKAVAGFTTESEGADGTIIAGQTREAVFTNTYSVKPVKFPTGDTLGGTKKLSGRPWSEKDSFTFFLNPYNNAPLPEDYDSSKGVTVTGPDEENEDIASFSFGTIEFTAPGIYRYTVVEKEPENNEYLPGMSYSRALYRIVVEVVDNGEGILNIESTDIQKLYEDNGTQLFTYDAQNEIVMNEGQDEQDSIEFVNTYTADAVTRVPVALKSYTDNSGMNPLVSGMFDFQLKAVGIVENRGTDAEKVVVPEDIKDIPMPEGSVNGVYTTTNEGTSVTFPGVEFEQGDIPSGSNEITFRYEMSEVVPADEVNGMTYDEKVYTIDIVVSIDADEAILNVNAIYPNGERIITFVNEYTQTPATVNINGSKTLVGRDMKVGETFEFDIAGANAATNNAVRNGIIVIPPRIVTVSGGKDGEAKAFAFGDIKFTKSGTYVFTVTETRGDAIGVAYDTSTVNVTVVIDDADKDGNLEATSITYSNNKEAAEFTNTYKAEFEGTPISLTGTKNLTGKSLLTGEFFFNVEERFNGSKVNESLVSHTVDEASDDTGVYSGTITLLKDVTYTEAGTYEYIITEQIPESKVGGTTYDESKYKFTVVVEDKDKVGKLTVTSARLEKADGNGWVTAENVVFNNTYTPTETTVAIPAMKKVIAGSRSEALKAGDFEFELAVKKADPSDGIKLPTPTTVTNAADGSISFGKLTFTKAGTYVVSVKEVIPADDEKIAGITYSDQEILLTYKVTDDRNGNLTATLVNMTGGNTFVNLYKANPAEVKVQIAKELTGRDWEADDKFDFEVVVLDPTTQDAVENGAIEFPLDAEEGTIATKSITAKDETVTGNIKIHAAGTYKFIVREITGDIPGVKYDSAAREITIVATDDSVNAEIDVTVFVNDEESTAVDGAHKLVFTNVYDADSTEISGHDHLMIEKKFTGRTNDTWLETDSFEFKLEAGDSATQTAIIQEKVELPSSTTLVVSNANKAHPHFGNIVFHEEGTYKFKVTEIAGSIKGVKYDTEPRYITVVVTDNKDGLLIASVDTEESDELIFNNVYSAKEVAVEGKTKLEIIKSLTGRKWMEGDEFTFNIRPYGEVTAEEIAAGNIVMPNENITITAGDKQTEDRAGAFGDITFKKAGDYRFIISEVNGDLTNMKYDIHEYHVFVKVTDNNEGKLVTDVTYSGSKVFVNTYESDPAEVKINLSGTKTLLNSDGNKIEKENWDDLEFQFIIQKYVYEDGAWKWIDTENVDVANKTDDKVDFVTDGRVLTFDEVGTYGYQVIEANHGKTVDGIVYDSEMHTFNVIVTDKDGDGVFETEVKSSHGENNSFTFDSETNTWVNNQINFVNKSNRGKTSELIMIKKQLENESGSNAVNLAGYQFELYKSNDDYTEIGELLKTTGKTDAAGETYVSLEYEYGQEETYYYILKEKPTGISQMTDSDKVYKFSVEVINANEGDVSSEIIAHDETPFEQFVSGAAGVNYVLATFTNVYDPEDAKITLDVNKVLNGRELAAEEFEFLLKQGNTELQKVSNDANGKVVFEELVFDKVGTYKYKVQEISGEKSGVKYDDTVYDVIITVTDNAGKLKASVDVLEISGTEMTFTNEYTAKPVSISLKGTKTLTGRDMKAGEFAFEITAKDNAPLPAETTVKNIAAESGEAAAFDFGKVTYEKAGTYEYEIREVIPDDQKLGGVTYDSEPVNVTVAVTDKFDGTFETEVTYQKDGKTVETAAFYNKYKTDDAVLDGKANLEVTKELMGRDWFENDEFTFTLATVDETTKKAVESGIVVLPEKLEIIADVDHQKANFGDITFKEVGTYEFVITEDAGEIAGVTYDTHAVTVTVVVTDNKLGQLVAAVPSYSGEMTFTNTYTPEAVTAVLEGTKELTGRTLAAEEFEFTIEAVTEGAPMPAAATVTNGIGDDVNKVSFGAIQYTKPGTYEYIIKETVPSEEDRHPSVKYDGGAVKAVVEVTYDASTGLLESEVSYKKNGGNGGEGFTFVNKYEASPVPVKIEAFKAVSAAEGNSFAMNGEDFEFEVEPAQSNPASDPIAQGYRTNAANGGVLFADVQYEQAGTYVYTVHEVDGNRAGIQYDDSVYVVIVEVTDNTNTGKLEAKISITKDGKEVNAIEFENGYTPGKATAVIHGHKTLEGGHKDLEAGEFKFNIKAVTEDAPMPEDTTVTNEVTGLFQFDAITYAAPGTYEYEISESNEGKAGYTYDDKIYKVLVVVTDENGELKADVSGVKTANNEPVIVFENSYIPKAAKVEIEAIKKLEGRNLNDEEFEFAVFNSEGKEVVAAKNNSEGKVEFDEITFDKAGTYNFTIVEKDVKVSGVTNNIDDVIYGVQVVVTDEGFDGALDATVTYLKDNTEVDKDEVVFTNKYEAAETSVQFGAAKVLNGRELAAGEFEFELKAVTKDAPMPEKTIAVNAADGAVLFDEINFDKAGTYVYSISEVEGTLESVTYDDTVYEVTVVVTDDLKGNLVAEIKYADDVDGIVFTNTFAKPALEIVKTQSVDGNEPTDEVIKVEKNDVVTYSITVSNTGDGIAKDVVIKDEVPEGLKLIKRSITEKGKEKDGVITWNIGDLPAGEAVTVSFDVKIPAVKEDTEWKNIATVQCSNDPDSDPENPDNPVEHPSNEVEMEGTPEKEIGDTAKTGDNTTIITYLFALLASLLAAFITLIVRRRNSYRR